MDESITTDHEAIKIASCIDSIASHQANQSWRIIWNLFWDLDYVIVT